MERKDYELEMKILSSIRSSWCLVGKKSSEDCETLISESVTFSQLLIAVVCDFSYVVFQLSTFLHF